MKISIALLLILTFIFATSFAIAQKNEEEEVPPGMEVLKIGDVRVITIIGTKIKKQGDLLVVEGTKEFVARKFIEMEDRFSEIDGKTKGLEKEVKKLKEALDEIKKNKPTENSTTDTTYTTEE